MLKEIMSINLIQGEFVLLTEFAFQSNSVFSLSFQSFATCKVAIFPVFPFRSAIVVHVYQDPEKVMPL